MILMEADLSKEFEMQEEIDGIIYRRFKVDPNKKKDELTLAVMDEICELMNKMRIHKFWSTKGMNERSDLLEEYVDTWHFILSIGNMIGVVKTHYGLEIRPTFTQQFRSALFTANDIFTPVGWTLFVSLWKGLGHMLSFTEEEVRAAFKEKHIKNLERQANDY